MKHGFGKVLAACISFCSFDGSCSQAFLHSPAKMETLSADDQEAQHEFLAAVEAAVAEAIERIHTETPAINARVLTALGPGATEIAVSQATRNEATKRTAVLGAQLVFEAFDRMEFPASNLNLITVPMGAFDEFRLQ